MDVVIRAVETEDHRQAWLRVRNGVDPRPLTPAGLLADRTWTPTVLDLVAWRGDEAVGAGGVAWGRIQEESHSVSLELWVLPEHRRQGAGGGLYDALATFAGAGGMHRATVGVAAHDTASRRFAEARGLVVDGGGQFGRLDLTRPDLAAEPEPIDGVTISTFGERPDLERDVYALYRLVQPEIPFLADEPIPSFEAWHEVSSGDEGFVHDLSLIALEGERVVGLLEIYDSADGTAFIGMTSVHPDARRRGIGRLLKQEMARRARDAGWRRIETFNDGTNARIRGLNESLGYVYDPPYLLLRGPLPG